ncbi:ATP-binding protein [Corallococcus sp. RDP092CA]|uniref:HD domain-containing protein n=1 Tax=Corallococcus sp. RDP092CA TaxID=3109369 RepID=UPI0035AED13B
MPATFEECAIIKFLSRDNDYHTRIVRIREEMGKWLQHTTALFPHYPDHTRAHSEQIIIQLSKLLFRNKKPVLPKFSRAEAYILVCAALLHDSGMVATHAQIEEIVQSKDWTSFTSDSGKGAAQWLAIQELKASNKPAALKDYLVGTQLRILIADFVRRQHHQRAPLTLELHPSIKELVDFNDRRYFEAISMIAVGHGLDRSEIGDTKRYKEVADLGGEEVNIQFMARLLRIGDLLDMRSARASHYACAAAAPLPADSQPHWKQYSTITHERVSPERIEYECECQDQDTHAILRDWFGWLSEEVREAGIAMQHTERHKEWVPPKCTVNNEWPSPATAHNAPHTITIKPSSTATYTFHRWKLELDQEQILDRLIYDIYDQPETFIRELIQNSLDATRCRLYEDFAVRYPTLSPPENPSKFPSDFRKDYPLTISNIVDISPRDKGEDSAQQAILIEDSGVGMDSTIVKRYLLQVGKSYYQSEEFRKNYKFAPTSRFGVGFLSVFAVSDLVVVESCKYPLPASEPHGLRLTLRGPKSFLLTERHQPFENRPAPKRHGTRIKVVLRNALPRGRLTELAKLWCRRVEVPVVINDLGTTTEITPQITQDRSTNTPSTLEPDANFVIRSFPFESGGLEGEVIKLAYINQKGESWLDEWPKETDITGKPLETTPKLPDNYYSLHGIYQGTTHSRQSKWHYAVDDRRHSAKTTMSRSGVPPQSNRQRPPVHVAPEQSLLEVTVRNEIGKALTKHLQEEPRARLEDGWIYAGRLLADPMVDPDLAWSWPATTRVYHQGRTQLISAREAANLPGLIVAFQQSDFLFKALQFAAPIAHIKEPFICNWETPAPLKRWIAGRITAGALSKTSCITENNIQTKTRRRWLFVTLSPEPSALAIDKIILTPIDGTSIRIASVADASITNTLQPLGAWLSMLHAAAHLPPQALPHSVVEAVFRAMSNPFGDDFKRLISKWRNSYPIGNPNALPTDVTDEEISSLGMTHGRFY